jgi:diacylglycerol kinase family enzyme
MPLIKILVNPTSGNGAGKKLFAEAKKFNTVCEIQETDPKNIIEQIKSFVVANDTVIIAGGDGTVNLVMNALYHSGLHQTVKVALFPLGTGNDLAKAYHIKQTSLELFLLNLTNRNIIQLPLWRFNDQIFTNYISWGIDAWALKLVTRWRRYFPQRRWLMQLLYFTAGILTLFRWKKIQLSSPELSIQTPLLSLILCNTNYYAGGCPVVIESNSAPQLHLIKIRHHWDLINLMSRRFSHTPYPTLPIELTTLHINTESVDAELDGEMLKDCKGTINYCGRINILA